MNFKLHVTTLKKVLPILKSCVGDKMTILGLLHLKITDKDCTITAANGIAAVMASGLGLIDEPNGEYELLVPSEFVSQVANKGKSVIGYVFLSVNDGNIECDDMTSYCYDTNYVKKYPDIAGLINKHKSDTPSNVSRIDTERLAEALNVDNRIYLFSNSEETFDTGEPKGFTLKQAENDEILGKVKTDKPFTVPMYGNMLKRITKLPKGEVSISVFEPTKDALGRNVPQPVLAEAWGVDLLLMPCYLRTEVAD